MMEKCAVAGSNNASGCAILNKAVDFQARKVLPMADENTRRWSQHVTQTSNALDLEPKVFAQDDPRKIARSLKRSAEQSNRRKSDPYRSAMSMLTFYINRAGTKLPKQQHQRLEAAKDELRALYGRPRKQAEIGKQQANRRKRSPAMHKA
jgi:hypothetical protein